PQPRTSLSVIRYTSLSLSAFWTASSFSGRMIATTIFMKKPRVIGSPGTAGAVAGRHRFGNRPLAADPGRPGGWETGGGRGRPAEGGGAGRRGGGVSGQRLDADAGRRQRRVRPQQALQAR